MVRMEIFDNQIPVFGTADDRTLNQIRVCARTADKVALMPDNHLGYGVPIGGVVAYRNAISPTGVGYDIGCGNKAVRLDMRGSELRANIARIMDDVWKIISFGVGRKNNEAGNEEIRSHVLFEDDAWKLKSISPLKQMARNQLGTVGSGNHYVDLFVDEEDRVWIGVHFGSRGLGHKTATWFLEAAGASDGMDVEPCVLSTASDLGTDYLEAMRLAGDYAYAGRDWVCTRVAAILGAPIVEEVHNHHNYAWREEHNGEMLWVVRKGATPAFPGQRGFVGGTMGEQSVILEGVENEHARYSLYSTVHGAGRAMGRREAAGVIDRETGAVKRAGRVTPEMMRGWVERAGIELRGAGLDESPDCYKRLDEVLDAVSDTVRILHRLTPVGVAMAGANEFDPYKD
ncbi:RtcB family protein [Terracidiphilus sp.]|uniref:RtcB family protein n=1 Tax=Terracidiphilus sp. TaxID=1964191 RepID=UPI003C18CCBC